MANRLVHERRIVSTDPRNDGARAGADQENQTLDRCYAESDIPLHAL